MTLTAIFRGKQHLEPPPWLYARMARSRWFRRVYHRLAADLGAHLPRGARVLDVGTGPGYLLHYLARDRPDLDLWGLDFAYGMIRRGRRRQQGSPVPGRRHWVVADALALPFPAATFQHVLTTFSFHIWPQPVLGLKEMLRVLQPGSQAWIYELQREAGKGEIRAFAREEALPFPLVYLGCKTASRHHAVPMADFTNLLTQAAGSQWRLTPAHHLFWRAELTRA